MFVEGKRYKTVFIMGAGASRGAFDHVLLNRKRLKPPLNGDFFNVAGTYVRAKGGTSADSQRLSRLRRFFKEGLPTKGTPTMEEAFSLLYMAKDFPAIYTQRVGRRPIAGHRKEIEDFLRLAFGIFTALDVRPECHTGYDRLVGKLTPDDTLVSLNYDTLLDSALVRHGWDPKSGYWLSGGSQKVKWEYERNVGGANLNGVHLIKLHGSVNWYVRGSFCDLRAIFSGKAVKVTHPRKNEIAGYLRQIVPPIYAKFFGHDQWRQLWGKAYKALCECEAVVVIGCSLIDTDFHLRALLGRVREVRRKGMPLRRAVFVDRKVKIRRKWKQVLKGSFKRDYEFNSFEQFLKELKA